MHLTSISVSCILVASCKQGYEFNNSKHEDRNKFNLISTYKTYIFVYTVAGKDGEKYKGEGKLTFGPNVKYYVAWRCSLILRSAVSNKILWFTQLRFLTHKPHRFQSSGTRIWGSSSKTSELLNFRDTGILFKYIYFCSIVVNLIRIDQDYRAPSRQSVSAVW